MESPLKKSRTVPGSELRAPRTTLAAPETLQKIDEEESPSELPSPLPTNFDFASQEYESSVVERCKDVLMGRASQNYIPDSLLHTGLEPLRSDLFNLLESSVKGSENVSALLMGFRGCGKSLVLKRVLMDLKQKYVPLGSGFVEVHLNGFIHSEDTLAIREICRQLRLENELEAMEAKESFFDHLAFLRDILAHTKKNESTCFLYFG
eukprot:TRINITY_DN20493_c0_g1_i1.p1 TRINITY_DN20493_c0_g1~~TRINITY_DN20493_c0_g1_i1.p1  ORF type:complete len:207 (+),score=31.04 TRINITY_DN20493_c0_g1_i1:57-677(+)